MGIWAWGKIALKKENEQGYIKMTLNQGLPEDLDKWRMEVEEGVVF